MKSEEEKIKGIIFDVDGTLLDSMKIWDEAGERYLRKKGLTAVEDLGAILFAMTMEEGAEYLKQNYGLQEGIQEIIHGINDTVLDFYENEVTLKSGVSELITYYKGKKIPITIATSSDREVIEKALSHVGILDDIQAIFTCSEIGVGKDKPDVYYAAADYMGIKASDIYVFEDALHAIKTAKEAGFLTVGVYDKTSDKVQEQIKEMADIYVRSLDEMPRLLAGAI